MSNPRRRSQTVEDIGLLPSPTSLTSSEGDSADGVVQRFPRPPHVEGMGTDDGSHYVTADESGQSQSGVSEEGHEY